MSVENAMERVDVQAARQAARDSLAFGVILSVLGVFAVVSPLFTGIAATALIGMLVIAGGIVGIVFAFQAGSLGKGILRFLFGGLSLVVGVWILATPLESLGGLTFVLAVFFLATGISDILLAFGNRGAAGRGWMLFSGILSIALGVFVIAQWPASGIWAVGLFLGIRLLTHGWVLMALGKAGQAMLTQLQDTRIEVLESYLRSSARVLNELQAAQSEHTAMLLALDSELRQKVSSSDVDPAIQDLNQTLGKAREKMQIAAEATQETWEQAQQASSEVFEELQKRTAGATEALKRSLGLDEAEPQPGSSPTE